MSINKQDRWWNQRSFIVRKWNCFVKLYSWSIHAVMIRAVSYWRLGSLLNLQMDLCGRFLALKLAQGWLLALCYLGLPNQQTSLIWHSRLRAVSSLQSSLILMKDGYCERSRKTMTWPATPAFLYYHVQCTTSKKNSLDTLVMTASTM